MPIVSITMIIEANRILTAENLALKLHLSDACGCQSMWLEKLEGCTDEMLLRTKEKLLDYFSAQKIPLRFSEDNLQIQVLR